jgi:hypothetical protein
VGAVCRLDDSAARDRRRAGEVVLKADGDTIELAKRALAFQKAFEVYFPEPAREMGELASRLLIAAKVRYWISPDGRSITCVRCRLTSSHPRDVAEKYCTSCHSFLEGTGDMHRTHYPGDCPDHEE